MINTVKAALIIAAGLVVAVFLYRYLSPYQTCVRAQTDNGVSYAYAAGACGRAVNSN